MKLTIDKIKVGDKIRNKTSGKIWEVTVDIRYRGEGFEICVFDGENNGRSMKLTEKNVGKYELLHCEWWSYSKHIRHGEIDKFREAAECEKCQAYDVCQVEKYFEEIKDEFC